MINFLFAAPEGVRREHNLLHLGHNWQPKGCDAEPRERGGGRRLGDFAVGRSQDNQQRRHDLFPSPRSHARAVLRGEFCSIGQLGLGAKLSVWPADRNLHRGRRSRLLLGRHQKTGRRHEGAQTHGDAGRAPPAQPHLRQGAVRHQPLVYQAHPLQHGDEQQRKRDQTVRDFYKKNVHFNH